MRSTLRHACWIVITSALLYTSALAEVVPLLRAHAHNDYQHPRPLFDALEQGFCSVEADVYLVNGELLVAHGRKECRPERTLSALYLDPLSKRVHELGGVYAGITNFTLWIDLKTDANISKGDPTKLKAESEKTSAAVNNLLVKYSSILTDFSRDQVKTNAITVIFTGTHPAIAHSRWAIYDHQLTGDSRKGGVATENWSRLCQWRGRGEMPSEERAKLRGLIMQAHNRGVKVRLWGYPDSVAIWKELDSAGVDWIGTDHLKELADFLKAEHHNSPQP